MVKLKHDVVGDENAGKPMMDMAGVYQPRREFSS
jgi:hypothetical protein